MRWLTGMLAASPVAAMACSVPCDQHLCCSIAPCKWLHVECDINASRVLILHPLLPPQLADILRSISPEELTRLRQGVSKYWRAFIWDQQAGGQAYNFTVLGLQRRYRWEGSRLLPVLHAACVRHTALCALHELLRGIRVQALLAHLLQHAWRAQHHCSCSHA